MADDVLFERDFEPAYGRLVPVMPGIRRFTAENPGPFTFRGTNAYVLGEGRVALVDPGPEDAAHVARLLDALDGEQVEAILLTHMHRDHSGAVAAIRAATGAPLHAMTPKAGGVGSGLDAAPLAGLLPDVPLEDGMVVTGTDWRAEVLATPGHASDHLCFVVGEALISGDHVMGWSTSVVAPPDGSMADYMASLDRLIARPERFYLPGHGGPILRGPEHARALRAHRRMREAAILDRVRGGEATVAGIVAGLYRGLDPRLTGAAALSVLAHLEDLAGRGLVETEGPARLDGRFAPPEV